MMDGVIQAASGSALSRALSNAGFGTICSNELSNNPPAPPPGNPPAAGQSSPGQSVVTAGPVPAPDQQSFLPRESNDPVAAAKAVIWPCNGPFKNMTMGEILATKPNQIIWIAENWKGTGSAKDAAVLLLDEAKKKSGK